MSSLFEINRRTCEGHLLRMDSFFHPTRLWQKKGEPQTKGSGARRPEGSTLGVPGTYGLAGGQPVGWMDIGPQTVPGTNQNSIKLAKRLLRALKSPGIRSWATFAHACHSRFWD